VTASIPAFIFSQFRCNWICLDEYWQHQLEPRLDVLASQFSHK